MQMRVIVHLDPDIQALLVDASPRIIIYTNICFDGLYTVKVLYANLLYYLKTL